MRRKKMRRREPDRHKDDAAIFCHGRALGPPWLHLLPTLRILRHGGRRPSLPTTTSAAPACGQRCRAQPARPWRGLHVHSVELQGQSRASIPQGSSRRAPSRSNHRDAVGAGPRLSHMRQGKPRRELRQSRRARLRRSTAGAGRRTAPEPLSVVKPAGGRTRRAATATTSNRETGVC